MALTRVSPALFATSNNITSVTVGGSANTISLTFDGSGVITSATNNAVSVANTAITGNIISSQITSVANTQITGLIQAAQIGSANATLVTSGTLPKTRLPAGSVLQVVTATYSTESDFSSTGFANTGLTATITPTSATSKILILVTQADCAKFDSNNFVKLKLLRDSTDILTFGATGAATNSTALNAIGSISASYLDSPATTSATTYKTQVASQLNSVGIRLQYNNSSSTITLMEIAV